MSLSQHIQTRTEGKKCCSGIYEDKKFKYLFHWHKETIVFWLWPASFTYEIFDKIKD